MGPVHAGILKPARAEGWGERSICISDQTCGMKLTFARASPTIVATDVWPNALKRWRKNSTPEPIISRNGRASNSRAGRLASTCHNCFAGHSVRSMHSRRPRCFSTDHQHATQTTGLSRHTRHPRSQLLKRAAIELPLPCPKKAVLSRFIPAWGTESLPRLGFSTGRRGVGHGVPPGWNAFPT